MLKRFRFIFTCIALLNATMVLSQSSQISGNISDEISGQPLQDVHIFIPNTTFQAFSDSLGGFVIAGIPEGKWVFHVRAHGWNDHIQEVVLKAGIPKINEVKLAPNQKLDPTGKELSKGPLAKTMDQVMEAFIGPDFKKRQIAILNPDKLVFERQEDKSLRLYSIGPIFFSNYESGYLVSTYFEPFVLGSTSAIRGTYSYFELPNDETSLPLRRQERLRIYEESPQRYLSELMTGALDNFGSTPNPEVSLADNPGDYTLSFAQPLLVNLADGQKGELSYSGERLAVKLNGAPVNPSDLVLGGVFARMNPIFGLPANFNTDKLVKLANLEKTAETMQERIFLHTDRKHYWPGENLYFKAYLNYGNPILAEELSSVLHVELLDSTGYSWMHRIYKISGGVSMGQLPLPDMEETGNFIIRAYTAWGQNYTESDFLLPIQILGHQYQPQSPELKQEAVGVGVFSDKQVYEGGEKVKLNIMATNRAGNPVNASLSVSVLDLNQAVHIPDVQEMEASFQPIESSGSIEDFAISVERGFSLEGQLLDRSGKPTEGSIKAFINGYTDTRTLKSDKSGKFELPSSNFDESFEIALQATDREALPVRSISLEIKNYPLRNFENPSSYPAVVERGLKPSPDIRPLSDLEVGEILMEEAVIEDKRELSMGPMIYGRPDKVVNTEDIFLNGTAIQFLYALSGQVPGMTVYGTPPAIRLRGGEPLVLINGAPVNSPSGGTFGGTGGGQTAYDVISNLDIFSIERVEVLRRTVPQYGDQGRNGVISIILKTGLDRSKAMEANMNNYTLFKFNGYPKSQPFQVAEQYRSEFPFLSEHKPTLYWNPNLITQQSRMSQQVEFTLNKQAGPMWVEIRGITDLGEPIHGTFLINDPSMIGK